MMAIAPDLCWRPASFFAETAAADKADDMPRVTMTTPLGSVFGMESTNSFVLVSPMVKVVGSCRVKVSFPKLTQVIAATSGVFASLRDEVDTDSLICPVARSMDAMADRPRGANARSLLSSKPWSK